MRFIRSGSQISDTRASACVPDNLPIDCLCWWVSILLDAYLIQLDVFIILATYIAWIHSSLKQIVSLEQAQTESTQT